jgi:pimeloyl-ACP methyl ester carboxylesterase
VGVTFALVHGAWHGAWSWERLLAPLERRGHRAVAVDLPSEDPEAGLEAYADAIAAALAGVEDDVIVVPHSLHGLPASLVAARRPVRSIAYLGAFVPVAGQSMSDQFRASPEPILIFEGGREIDELGRSRWTDEATTARIMYPDLSPEDVRWAFPRLRRQAGRSQREPHPTGLPDVPAASIVCTEDRVVNPAWSRRVARERLGVEPIELPAGHFPMIAAPELLADALDAIARE